MNEAMMLDDVVFEHVRTNGIEMQVACAGEGSPVVLLHGWPHTWYVWNAVIPELSRHHRIIAPDLRGIGGTTRARTGYDIGTLSSDICGLMSALDARNATVVAIDAGAPVAWMLAMRHPGLVGRLVLMESLLGTLPGAETFLSKGPPWWFGFHSIPDFAEHVIAGNEARYLDFFLSAGSVREIDSRTRDAFVSAYTGSDALRCGFEYYRAMRTNADQIAATVLSRRLTMPTIAIGGNMVGDALYHQLLPIADDLTGHIIPDCGHIVPLDRPDAVIDIIREFART